MAYTPTLHSQGQITKIWNSRFETELEHEWLAHAFEFEKVTAKGGKENGSPEIKKARGSLGLFKILGCQLSVLADRKLTKNEFRT